MTCCEKGTLFVVIEQMLQTGRREEAALLASKNKEWALALLIASNVAVGLAQVVVKLLGVKVIVGVIVLLSTVAVAVPTHPVPLSVTITV